jgi:hypothetical protein
VSQYCGSNNCKGPCSNPSTTCNWASNQYSCQVNISTVNTAWWATPAFIGSMVGLGVIIIVVVILIIVVARNNEVIIDAELSN